MMKIEISDMIFSVKLKYVQVHRLVVTCTPYNTLGSGPFGYVELNGTN